MGTFLDADGQVLGVIALEHPDKPYVYDPHDLRILQIFGEAVTGALRRIDLE